MSFPHVWKTADIWYISKLSVRCRWIMSLYKLSFADSEKLIGVPPSSSSIHDTATSPTSFPPSESGWNFPTSINSKTRVPVTWLPAVDHMTGGGAAGGSECRLQALATSGRQMTPTWQPAPGTHVPHEYARSKTIHLFNIYPEQLNHRLKTPSLSATVCSCL